MGSSTFKQVTISLFLDISPVPVYWKGVASGIKQEKKWIKYT